LHCQTSNGVSCTECNSDNHDENGTCAKGYVENCSVYDGEKCQTCNSNNLVVLSNSCVAGKTIKKDNYETPAYKITLNGNNVYITEQFGSSNGFEDAEQQCSSRGMSLPTNDQLISIYSQRGTNLIPSTVSNAGFWSSSPGSDSSNGYAVCFDGSYAASICGQSGVPILMPRGAGFNFICISN
ncbi:hypothetical protein IJ732_06685, partial [bacterium]|nr:hypothetical protein [bacterium]